MTINERIVSLGKLEQYSNETSENIKEYVNNKISEVIHPDYDLVKKNTADEGFTASYNLTKNGEIVGATINIPKDYLVKSADIKVVEMADTPVEGYVVGDKYIDFVVNTVDDSGNVSHIYLLVTELVDVYKAGDGIVIGTDNTITLVIQDGTKTVGGVSTDDYNAFKSAVEDSHIHSNKSVLDEINESVVKGGNSLSGSTGYSVDDSVDYPLVGLKVYGKSEQKQYSGKNLLNTTFGNAEHDGIKIVKNSDGTYTASGTASYDFTHRLAENVCFENGKPYKLVGCPSGGSINTYFIASNTLLYADMGSGISRTPNRDINNDYVYICIKEGVTCNNLVFKPMLTTDLTATYDDYEPYVGGIPSPNPDYPQEIISVTQPTVTVCGKNLINAMYQTTTKGGITCTNNSNGTYTLNGTATSEAVFTIVSRLDISGTYRIIGCPPNGSNGTYNISVNVDGAWSVNNYDIGNGSIINPSSYIIIAIAIRNGVTCNNLVFKPMLTTDLTATYNDFEQHKENTLPLSDTLNAIPVSSGGNVTIDGQEYIADYVDFERGVKVQRVVGFDIANGTWKEGVSGHYTYYVNSNRYPFSEDLYWICDKLVATNGVNNFSDAVEGIYTDDNMITIGGSYDRFNLRVKRQTGLTSEQINEILGDSCVVYGVAKTPIETPLSETELQAYRQLQTYNGVTNIINDKGAGLSVEYCTSKMLAEYALPLIKNLKAENVKKDEEISVLKTDILNNENKITELQNENSLNEKVKFLNNMQRTGKVYTVRFPLWETSQTCDGEKLDDNAGLVCNPSTATTRGISDYDNIPLFITYDCNAYVDEDGVRHITAIKGDENYRDTGKVDVFVLGTSYYEKSWVEGGYMYYSCTDLPRDGYVLASECKTKDGKDQGFALYPKCYAGDIDGKPYGSFGLVPARYCEGRPAGSQSISYSGNISYFHQRGSHYSGTFASELKYITTRWWLKYGTRNSQSVMAGCTDYNAQYVATVAETGAKRIIIANANAAYFEVGMPVSIGDNGRSKPDRNVWACHNKAESATITAIEAYDDNNKAIYVDADTAFNTTTSTYISTFYWRSGFSNKVLGRDGSPCSTSAGLTNGKYPAVIQGIECFAGIWDTISNAIADIVDSTGKRDVYITNDSTKLSADITTIKSTYSKTAGQITPTSFNTWNYITAVDCDVENGVIVPTAAGQSGSSTTTGYADGLNYASSGQREILCFGHLGDGSLCGVSCLLASYGLDSARWRIGARLSING